MGDVLAKYDLSTLSGRLKALWDFWWGDHAYLRLFFPNAHWVDEKLVRTNQPWPFQLGWWKAQGIRTVINLRGGTVSSFYELEDDACRRLDLTMISFIVTSRDAPSREQILGAKALFEQITYPALIHCKSGADRAGLMSVLYRHFHKGEPIQVAMQELGLRTLHMEAGKTGVLDYVFHRYLDEAEPKGLSFEDWVRSDAYDHEAIKQDFKASWWGTLLTEKILRRE